MTALAADDPRPVIDLAGARLLLTNDDGIAAEGLAVLEEVARSLTDDVWVVAPETEQSGAGHSLTIHRPLRLRQLDAQRFAVDGTPTDCVLLALNHIMSGDRPALVLSGINRGSNVGEDVTYSGTVAAAMEATLLGVPAVAISQQVQEDRPPDWDTARSHVGQVIRTVASVPWPRDVLINVNLPAVPAGAVGGICVASQGNRKLGDRLDQRVDPRGRAYFWIGGPRQDEAVGTDTDVGVVAGGRIAVTPLFLNLTYRPLLDTLRQAFA